MGFPASGSTPMSNAAPSGATIAECINSAVRVSTAAGAVGDSPGRERRPVASVLGRRLRLALEQRVAIGIDFLVSDLASFRQERVEGIVIRTGKSGFATPARSDASPFAR